MYVYGWFVPLYSCFRTLREQYRSQNCDNGGTTPPNSPVKYEVKRCSYLCACVCVCVCACVYVCVYVRACVGVGWGYGAGILQAVIRSNMQTRPTRDPLYGWLV